MTLRLATEIERIYFCPDYEGEICHCVDGSRVLSWERKPTARCATRLHENWPSFRKPGSGMLDLAMAELRVKEGDQCWMIGDRPEDQQAAEATKIPFLPADIWHQRFSPGFQEMQKVTRAQLEFLEGL